jgi:allantoinase
MIDAAIWSNRVITPQGIQPAGVLIHNGKIEAVVSALPQGDFPVTDLKDWVLMPGIVDPHVHINEPGRTEWEGFDTATRAAMAGGICSLVEMPLNASPVTTTVQALEKKLEAAAGKLHVHTGFWGGIIPGNEKEIEPLIEKGVPGFKAFLTHSGIDEFPNVTEADLRKAMPLVAKHDLPLLVHCEISDTEQRSPAGTRLYRDYLASRPASWEDDAIALMIRLSEEFDCRVHIVHLSSASSIQQIIDAKNKGLPLTVETAQHYLYFNAEEIPDGRTEYKCAPPVREKKNNEQLWQGLKNGIIDFVATDHSPAPPSMKELSSGDWMKAWGGIASLQLALPVVWTAAKKHNCGLTDIAKWLCEKPALLPQLATKGKIAPGYDADLCVWNPEESFTVTPGMILHRHKLTPYTGEKLYGVVKQTWLKGEKVYDAGRPPARSDHTGGDGLTGRGKFLHLGKGEILYR